VSLRERWRAVLAALRGAPTQDSSAAAALREAEMDGDPTELEERIERRHAWMRALQKDPSLALLLVDPLMANLVLESFVKPRKRSTSKDSK
jgi:hypothetical protein